MADAMRLAFADRSIWMGDADFVAGAGQGSAATRPTSASAQRADRAGRAHQPEPAARRSAAVRDRGLKSRHAPGRGRAGHRPRRDDDALLGGRQVGQHGVVHQHHRVLARHRRVRRLQEIRTASFRNLGFLLNNELTDFNTTPTTNPFTGSAGFNDVQPNKRPRSSMTPTMIFSPDGEPLVAYGSPGGATIINSVLNVTLNLIDHKMTLQDAIDAPRVSVTSTGTAISLEPGFPQATRDGLLALGYTLPATAFDIGSVQAVIVDRQTGKQYGGADPRREGTVIGLPRPGGH